MPDGVYTTWRQLRCITCHLGYTKTHFDGSSTIFKFNYQLRYIYGLYFNSAQLHTKFNAEKKWKNFKICKILLTIKSLNFVWSYALLKYSPYIFLSQQLNLNIVEEPSKWVLVYPRWHVIHRSQRGYTGADKLKIFQHNPLRLIFYGFHSLLLCPFTAASLNLSASGLQDVLPRQTYIWCLWKASYFSSCVHACAASERERHNKQAPAGQVREQLSCTIFPHL